jgi:hypothetical protein
MMKPAPDTTQADETREVPLPLQPPVETPAALLEARMEAAGRRMAAYLRHLPLPERARHELALTALTRLAEDPGDNPLQAEARAMGILRELLAGRPLSVAAIPGPALERQHMKPEEMDRRPWVRTFLRASRPVWNASAAFFNTSLMDILLCALILAGLRLLDMLQP